MITTNLTGNFGNNISQLIVCRVVAEKLGYDWGVNPNPTHDYYGGANQMEFMNVDFGNTNITNIHNEFHEKWVTYNNANITMFDKEIYNIKDNTILLGGNGAKGGIYQSDGYFRDRINDIRNWYKIKPEYKQRYDEKLNTLGIVLGDDTCVINIRGGEYRSIPHVLLRKEYYDKAIGIMIQKIPNIKFICITDDIALANQQLTNIPTYHFDIGMDYYVINKAKNIILSNSSFGLWAALLNTNDSFVVAPKYWSQHNNSDGYWGIGDQYYLEFSYMDKEGNLFDYETCKTQAVEYYKNKNLL